jgi:PIN domain nuclease of toxin-antitoxin system
MLYLDTHVVVWLYQKDESRLAGRPRALVEEHDLLISPIVLLELEYLYETKRIVETGRTIVDDLAARIQLGLCPRAFQDVARMAAGIRWTRDPFDRIITAQAALADALLLTKDGDIQSHYPHAVWQ